MPYVYYLNSDKYSIQQTTVLILKIKTIGILKKFENLLYILQYKTMQQYKKILNLKHDMAS